MENIKALLSLIDAYNSIIVNEEIGLIGEMGEEERKLLKEKWHGRIYDTRDAQLMHNGKMKILDEYSIIGSDGVFLINEVCTGLGLLYEQGILIGYLGILRDFYIDNLIDDFFGDIGNKQGAIVIMLKTEGDYDIYTNSKELNRYKYDSEIEFTKGKNLYFRNKKYIYHDLDRLNHIFSLDQG